jgi:signal transduction histidine kinase
MARKEPRESSRDKGLEARNASGVTPTDDNGDAQAWVRRAEVLRRLRTAQQYGAANAVISRLAHDLGTALNVVAGRAALIVAGRLEASEARSSAQVIEQKAQEMETALRRVLDFARRFPTRRQLVALPALVERIVGLQRPLAEAASMTLTARPDPEHATMPDVFVDPETVELVLLQLTDHAIEVCARGNAVEVSFARERIAVPRNVHAQPGFYVAVQVVHDGPSLCPKSLADALDPLPKKGSIPEGVRLGLFTVARLAREHGGWIEAAPVEGSKSGFVVFLLEARADAEPRGEGVSAGAR